MFEFKTGALRASRPIATMILVLAIVAGCANTEAPGANVDPYEGFNRKIHAFNKAADVVIRPVSRAYGTVVPRPVRSTIDNAYDNLNLPGQFVNHVLQGDVKDAGETFVRFSMNSIFGLGGLTDPASDAGVFERPTDFGETLARWGVRRGGYIELPILGPSSERDVVGRVVDQIIDPVSALLPTDLDLVRSGARVAGIVNLRYELRNVIDTLLYESVDSYTALRIAYLQNKARSVKGELTFDDLEDPYALD